MASNYPNTSSSQVAIQIEDLGGINASETTRIEETEEKGELIYQ